METKTWVVNYSKGTQTYASRVFKGYGAARMTAEARRSEGADHVVIYGYDEMAHRNFIEE